MWMEVFLEVLFCRAPYCHFTDNPTESFNINHIKFLVPNMLLQQDH